MILLSGDVGFMRMLAVVLQIYVNFLGLRMSVHIVLSNTIVEPDTGDTVSKNSAYTQVYCFNVQYN